MRLYALFSILFLYTMLFSSEEYYPAGGLKLFNKPIYLGGYISLVSIEDNQGKTIKMDEAALMIYGKNNKLSFMSEFEIWEPYIKKFGQMGTEKVQARFFIERLYATYYIDDESEIKIGKMFSQVGFWNTFSINVLTDTTSDPNFIKYFFPQMTTGILYNRYFNQTLLQVTFQNNPGIDDQYNNFQTDRHYATALSYEKDEYIVKTGIGWFETEKKEGSFYATLGYRHHLSKLSFMAESVARKTSNIDEFLYGAYMQTVWHFKSKHDLIFRFERYKKESSNTINEHILGYSYRPKYYMALKGEVGIVESQKRWIVSFSMMF